jgi:hypothetical protein
MRPELALRSPDGAARLDDLLALVGLPSQRHSASEMSGAAQEILRGIRSFVDGLLLRAIATHNENDFASVRTEVFGDYARSVTYLAMLVRMLVPEPVIGRALEDSFWELEAEFREHGLTRFGRAATDQARLRSGR